MSDSVRRDALIERLSKNLTPVRQLPPSGIRVAAWLALVAAIGLAFAPLADFGQIRHRLEAVPDMWLAVLGSTLTAICASYAALQTSLPDRNPRWALLPLLPFALWVGASGMGCLRGWLVDADTHAASMPEMRVCLVFIVGISIPLSAVLTVMLRRACPLRPNLTAVLAGLASAGAAATLLNIFHPFDAAATDLLIHALAVGVVILANRIFGGRLLRIT